MDKAGQLCYYRSNEHSRNEPQHHDENTSVNSRIA
mgnify:CR=1 FL=1